MRKQLKKIVLIMAMQEEAQAIIEHFKAKKIASNDIENIRYRFEGVDGLEVVLSINGFDSVHQVESVGTQPAALNTLSCIREFEPDLIVNAGTAGGFGKKGAEIGDMFVATDKVYFHDRRIPLTPEYKSYGIGAYPCLPWGGEIAKLLSAKSGIICTSDSFDMSEIDKQQMESFGADAKEMEAAAIAYVCQKLETPLLILKSITDLVDVPVASEEQFMANLAESAESLRTGLIKLFSADLNKLQNNSLEA